MAGPRHDATVMWSVAAAVLVATLTAADPPVAGAKLDGRRTDPQEQAPARGAGTPDVVWLEDEMCFCEAPRLPPVADAFRTPFGRARRVHSDFRGRAVRGVEDL